MRALIVILFILPTFAMAQSGGLKKKDDLNTLLKRASGGIESKDFHSCPDSYSGNCPTEANMSYYQNNKSATTASALLNGETPPPQHSPLPGKSGY